MPLRLPSLHSHRRTGSNSEPQPEAFRVTSPLSPTSPTSPSQYGSATSPPATDTSAPPSILRRGPQSSVSSDNGSTHSGSASASLSKRLSALAFDRTDTVSSLPESDGEDGYSRSTPGTSISSSSNQCPLPSSSLTHLLPFFSMTLSSTSTLSFIALPPAMRPTVLDAITRAWRRGVGKVNQVEYKPELMRRHKEKGCEGGVWEVSLKGDCWVPQSQDKVSSKRILVYLMTEFAKEGYTLASSYRMSKSDTGKDTLVFIRGEPDPEPIFFAVAFHSSDRVWIIDAPADVGESLEEGIKSAWLDGIQAARTRERHCREIKLRGNPWTSSSTSSLISARSIQLVIMGNITRACHGYDFVGSIDMADLEEGELPTTFYRARRTCP